MPYLRLLAAELAIGAAAIFGRFALVGAGPLAVSALRLCIATLAVLLLGRGLPRLSKGREIAFALAGFALAVHFATWFASLEYTSVAVSTLLVCTTPIFTEAYDTIRDRRRPSLSYASAVACAIAGVAFIASARGVRPAPIPGHESLGDALALIGAVAIGAYLLLVRAAGKDGAGRLATRAIVLRTYGWAALVLGIAAACAGQAPPALGNTGPWIAIITMALVSQLLGHTALNAALRDFTPSAIAMATLSEPVIAAIFAAAILGETLSWQSGAGGALVLAAIAVVLRATPHADVVESAIEIA